MYVAVKGGEAAIANAHRLLGDRRRGDRAGEPGANDCLVPEPLARSTDRLKRRQDCTCSRPSLVCIQFRLLSKFRFLRLMELLSQSSLLDVRVPPDEVSHLPIVSTYLPIVL